MSDPLSPTNAYNDGYPYGFVLGLKVFEGSVPPQEFITEGASPKEEGVDVPRVSPSYRKEWVKEFKRGWFAGYTDASTTGVYPEPIDPDKAYDLGVAAGYPYGFVEGRSGYGPPMEGKTPEVVGRELPPGWGLAERSAWSEGFSDGWLAGYLEGFTDHPEWPDTGTGYMPPPFHLIPVGPPQFYPAPFVPGYPQAQAPNESPEPPPSDTPNEDSSEQKDNASSSTPWIVGGVVALAAIGGAIWWMSPKRAA